MFTLDLWANLAGPRLGERQSWTYEVAPLLFGILGGVGRVARPRIIVIVVVAKRARTGVQKARRPRHGQQEL